jgi:hypothetical protein
VPEPGTTAPDLAAELDVVIDALLPAESVARGS